MSIVGLSRGADLENNLFNAIEMAGGLKQTCGQRVLIKPNVNSDDPYPATTNPQMLALLVRYLKSHGVRLVTVGDASNISYIPTVKTMKKLGLYQAAVNEGAQVVGFEEYGFEKIDALEADNWKTLTIPKVFTEHECIINLFNVKTHFLANYSMALKNWMGTVSHRSRLSMHSSPRQKFLRMIAEISLFRRADFFIGDGTQCLVTGGPFSGEVEDAGIVFAGDDPVAMDVTGLSILKMLGKSEKQITGTSIWQQPVIKRAVEIGIGAKSSEEIELNSEDKELIRELTPFIEQKELKVA